MFILRQFTLKFTISFVSGWCKIWKLRYQVMICKISLSFFDIGSFVHSFELCSGSLSCCKRKFCPIILPPEGIACLCNIEWYSYLSIMLLILKFPAIPCQKHFQTITVPAICLSLGSMQFSFIRSEGVSLKNALRWLPKSSNKDPSVHSNFSSFHFYFHRYSAFLYFLGRGLLMCSLFTLFI